MNSIQMLSLRAWSISFGRLALCSRLLKKILVMFLIHGRKKKYVAAAEYFDLKKFLKE